MPNYTTKQCPICGKEFTVPLANKKQKSCSRECGQTRAPISRRCPVRQPNTETYLVPLTKGYHVIVDACDVDLAECSWFAYEKKSNRTVYAVRHDRRTKDGQPTVQLHRVILSRVVGRPLRINEHVDHINGDGLDNRRANLRVATAAQNQANRKIPISNTSGYKGVSWHKKDCKWQAKIKVNYRTIYLGTFSDPEEAHAAYIAAAKKYFGEFASDGGIR